MNYGKFKSDLFILIQNITFPTPIIWANQSEPRPGKPYFTMYVTTGSDLLSFEELNFEGNFKRVSQRRATVSFNCFGHESIELMTQLQTAFQSDKEVLNFSRKNIALIDEGVVTDLTTLIDTRYESRSQMDCTFNWTSIVDEPIESIEEVVVNNNVIS